MENFHSFVENILKRNKKHKFVIIVDGLDNLDGKDSNEDLLWLPTQFSASARVILSCCPGSVSSILQRRGCQTLAIEPLEEAERISLLRLHLNINSKKLSEPQEVGKKKNRDCFFVNLVFG